jgi:hypothetical protein
LISNYAVSGSFKGQLIRPLYLKIDDYPDKFATFAAHFRILQKSGLPTGQKVLRLFGGASRV